MYRLRPAPFSDRPPQAHLLGSGPILREALRAQMILAEQFGVAADVWSVTSYKELRREALEVERWNLLHPRQIPQQSYVQQMLADQPGVFVAATDYMRSVPEMIARWVPGGLFPLGTDGFGRSETRAALRRFFEVDAECIAIAALSQLARHALLDAGIVEPAIHRLGVNPEKVNPMRT
jgi:pyruvate dehydrogenase E1 component